MDDILNDSPEGFETYPVELSDLVETQPATTTAPTGAVRNRAATSAILSGGPDQMIEKYRLLMQEGMEGSTVTHDQVMQSLEEQNKTKSMRHVINIMGDKSIPLDQKKRLMNFVQTKGWKEEPAVTLQTKALESPSEGEDMKGEAARISLSDTMGQINQEAQERQRMINGLLATHPDDVAGFVTGLAEAEVMPFGRNIIGAKVSASVDEMDGKTASLGKWVKNFLLPGSTKADLQERLMSIPPAKRGEYTAKLLGAIKESATVFHSDNFYAQYATAVQLLDSPAQSDSAVWLENMMTVFDAFWVGSEIRALGAVGKAAGKAGATFDTSKARRPGSANPGVSDAENVVESAKWEVVKDPHNPFAARIGDPKKQIEYKRSDAHKRLEMGSVVRRENPVAPYNVIEQANPASARELHEVIRTGDDELAEALTGVSRTQAIANNTYPQVGSETGNVLNKVDQSIREQVSNTGATRYTPEEFESAVDVIKRDFRNASNLQINDTMTTFRVDGDHMIIEGHYSTPGGAFLTPEAAREQAKYSLRGYGITDDEIIVMRRDGMEYVPHPKNVLDDAVVTGNDSMHVMRDDSGKEIGKIWSKVDPSNPNVVKISSSGIHDVSAKGKGYGSRAYSELIDKAIASGKEVRSDKSVSPDAQRIYSSLKKRGYVVEESPNLIKEKDGSVLSRNGYVYRVTGKAASETKVQDYIIKVKTKQPIGDQDVQSWNPLDVKRNWTDKITQTISEDKGSLSGWLSDPASMLHPVITGSASIASDQAIVLENMLLKPIKEFRSAVTSLPKDRRFLVEEYIKEANEKGLALDHFDLVARGFQPNEIQSLKQWKDIWDNHYYLENYDMVRTLNSQGYQIFENANTKLFGKPVQKNQNISAVFDPQTNNVRHVPKAEMDTLYNMGGSYVKLRRPVNIGGQEVDHMMVRNTPSEYIRKVRDTDQILNYRNGYYTVNYNKGAKFVDEITYDSAGNEKRLTVGVAGSTKDAEMFANAQQSSTGNLHMIREDSRGFPKDGDGYWDVNSASGRIAQRLRGQPLVSAKGINQLGSGAFVENPMESAARAARSISGRTVNRPVLETAKARFLKQYNDFLPSDGMGGKRFPNHHSEIVDHRSHTSKAVADARTTYGYIKYLEDGYINSADNLFKGGMNAIAEMLNKVPAAERAALAAGRVSPSHLAKSIVFQAYIVGSNPIRQWIVQSHQATRMAAYNPVGLLNGGMHKRMVGYIGEYAGFKQGSAMQDFIKFVDDSGMVAGVDRNSLVRGMGLNMADSSSKMKRYAGAVGSVPQTVGFDVGEKINQLGHLAAVHEKYTRQGIDLTNKTNRDLALTEARALSYDLNRAGELTYTQSTPAVILQFLQMPHKGILQLTNRKLPTSVALRLAAWDLVMFGVGGGMLLEGLRKVWTAVGENGDDILPDDPDKRDIFVYGMESYALNKMFSWMDESGEKSRIDFTALTPNDMEGWARMYRALMDDGIMAALAASPAGQLFAIDGVRDSKRNGRIPTAIITMGKYFNVFEELDPENPTEFTDVLNDVAKITSGWTAAQNAKLMYETRRKLDASGSVIDGQVTMPELWASGLGFGTLSTKELYMISRNRADDKKRHEEDVMKRYRSIMNYYRDELGKDDGDVAHTQKVTSMLMRTFDEPGDLDLVIRQWKRDMSGKEVGLLKQMLEASGVPDSRKMEDDIKMWNVDEQTKALMLDRVKGMRELRKNNEEN